MHVVVVESPAKARTVRRLLGAGHTVIATGGHVRDLPAKDGSVDPASGFAIAYATRRGKAPTLRAIAKALDGADALVLATDCQSALKIDPLSACKTDPPERHGGGCPGSQ